MSMGGKGGREEEKYIYIYLFIYIKLIGVLTFYIRNGSVGILMYTFCGKYSKDNVQ